MMNLEYTKGEIKVLENYMTVNYNLINQLLTCDAESDIALLSDEVENKVVKLSYERNEIIDSLIDFKSMYKLFMKKLYSSENSNQVFYRGTNLAEIDRLKKEPFIDRIWTVTTTSKKAEKYASNWNRPVGIRIILDKNVPFIRYGDLTENKKDNDTIILAPFTKIKSIEEDVSINEENSKYYKFYNVEIVKQDIDKIEEKEKNNLYNYILENSYSIRKKVEDCIKLEKENTINYENVRNMEHLLTQYENALEDSSSERKADYSDIERVSSEIATLKKISTSVFEIRKEYINFINMWKRNIAVYMMSECKEIEEQFIDLEVKYVSNNKEENVESENNQDEVENTTIDDTNKIEEVEKELVEDIQAKATGEIIDDPDLLVNLKINGEEVDFSSIEDSVDDTKKIVDNQDLSESKEVTSKETIIMPNIKEAASELQETKKVEEVENPFTNSKKDFNEEIKRIKEEINNTIRENNVVIGKNETDKKVTYNDVAVSIEPINDGNTLHNRVRSESKENVVNSNNLVENINKLIAKQQNHARVAGNIGTEYSALNNAFDMKKSAEKLQNLIYKIDKKVDDLCDTDNYSERSELNLELMSRSNIEISTLFNYLNNPKIAIGNSKVSRFEEMAIIEENELKRGIAQKIREICSEAELKKLRDDTECIEDKGLIAKIIGFFTGRNKLDEFLLEQINVRENAIRKTMSQRLSLAKNYSIHELIAYIAMFIEDNEEDELVENDVLELKNITAGLKSNYVVLDSKVQSILDDKKKKNLPYDSRKMSKCETIEVDTYQFLNKYGYDAQDNKEEQVQYQDTMLNEINRIIEYIEGSNIL